MIMLGYALQMGALPLSAEAMELAIRLNGADVAGTLYAFRLGRLYFADPEMAGGLLAPDEPAMTMAPKPVDTLQERIAVRVDALQAYQDAAYAERFPSPGRTRAKRGRQGGRRLNPTDRSRSQERLQTHGLQGRV